MKRKEYTMDLAIQTYQAWQQLGMDGALCAIKEAGFDGVDLSFYYDASAALLGDDYREKAFEIKEALEKYSLRCSQAHAPIECWYGMPFDDSAEPYLRLKRCIESCSIIGIDHVVIEGTECPHPHASLQNMEYNYGFYKSLEPVLEKWNVVCGIENLRKSFTYPDLCNEIIRRLDSPYFRLVFDVGHSWVRADMQPGEFVRELDPGIICGLHVHDTFGIRGGVDGHLMPWMCEIDYDDLVKALREYGYSGDMTLENSAFMRIYAAHDLLKPALSFSEAVGRKLISSFLNA